MMNKLMLSLLGGALAFTACKKEDPVETATNPGATLKSIALNLSGLSSLGADYEYETWIIVNGSPVSLGTFDIDASGNPTVTSFSGNASDVDNATAFVLSIEPAVDSDPAPSNVKLLGGDFSGNGATLSIDHTAALGNDLSTAGGNYIHATPTTTSTTDGLSGVWFFDPSTTTPTPLTLPTLPTGWEYEGWTVISGTPVSTGKFTMASGSDTPLTMPHNGTDAAAPAFPGEDFILNAPAGLTFPTDLSGATMVISIEPVPDNSAAPFDLKPLVNMSPSPAAVGTPYSFTNQSATNNPTGSVTR